MCFKKKNEINEEFFLYLCEEYFGKGNYESNLVFDSIINESALELLPDIDSFLEKEEGYTADEVCKICRDLALKTLLIIELEKDKDNHLVNLIHQKYPKELERLLKNQLSDTLLK